MTKCIKSVKQLVPFRAPIDTAPILQKVKANLSAIDEVVQSAIVNSSSEKCTINEDHINEVVDCLKTLNDERLWLYEALEAESITSSVLRNRLFSIPQDINTEMKDAIRSARLSNTENIRRYQNRLLKTEERLEKLQGDLTFVTQENNVLGDELKQVQSDYDTVVTRLNDTLSNKATMQIELNETRSTLTKTYRKTREFEEASIELSEDLKCDRFEASEAKQNFKSGIEEMENKIQEQIVENESKQLDLQKATKIRDENNVQLEKQRETLARNIATCSKLESDKTLKCAELEREIEKTKNHKIKKLALEEELVQISEDFKVKKAKYMKEVALLDEQLTLAQNENNQLASRRKKILQMLNAAKYATRNDKDNVEEMKRMLRMAKHNLQHQTSEYTRLRKENTELEENMEQTFKDHQAAAVLYENEIHQLTQQYDAEIKDRNALKLQKKELNEQHQDYVISITQSISDTTNKIAHAKLQHKNNVQLGKTMQQEAIQKENEIKNQQRLLSDTKSSFADMKQKLTGRISDLKCSIAKLEEDLLVSLKREEIEKPKFVELKEHHAKIAAELDKSKKDLIARKARKEDLIRIKATKEEQLENMVAPKVKLEGNFKAKREDFVEQLRVETKTIQQMEMLLYETGEKLNMLLFHNNNFEKAIDYFTKDVGFMNECMDNMNKKKITADEIIVKYQHWLEEQWVKQKQMDKKYQEEDTLLLKKLATVIKNTSHRDKFVSSVHEKLEMKLADLSSFIERASQPCC